MTKSQKIAIVFLLAVIIIVFVIGVIMGAFWTGRSSYNEESKMSSSANLIDAEFILAATATGKVKTISGRYITLEQQGREQIINAREDAQILSALMETDPVTGNLTSGAPKTTDFNAIKINDLISITLVKDSSGKLAADKIYIFMSEGAQ